MMLTKKEQTYLKKKKKSDVFNVIRLVVCLNSHALHIWPSEALYSANMGTSHSTNWASTYLTK